MENTYNLLLTRNISSDDKSFKAALKRFICIFLFYTLFIFYIVNSIVPGAYMDEIFHFPQALKYYNGVYTEWDPKITTPPGLYLTSVIALAPLSKLFGLDFNKIACFRIINVFFSVGNFYLLFKILRKQSRGIKSFIHFQCALNIAMFPVLYFFSFLYYTDCGSTFFVLLMYYLHLEASYLSAAVAGAFSVLFRQTNIIWMFYVAVDEVLYSILLLHEETTEQKEKNLNDRTPFQHLKEVIATIKSDWKVVVTRMLEVTVGYIAVAVSFICFMFINGSIVLGDKSAHQACLHVPQFFYFLLFTLFFSSPYLISVKNAKEFLNSVFAHKLLSVVIFMFCSFCVVHLSHVHPYLLADNRHLTFYIWRRILGRNICLSLALIPVYMYSIWSISKALCLRNSVFKIILAVCICLSIVPQKLLEFRYFILPYIIVRMHLKTVSRWQPYFEFILYTLVNFAVLYLFLFKPFSWETSDEVQRFMW